MNIREFFKFDQVIEFSFPGKLEFMCYVEDETLLYESDEERETRSCIENFRRVMELTQKSDYLRYQVNAFSLLVAELEKEPGGICRITTFSKEPFYQYHLFQNGETGKPYGCTWGPDIHKTPRKIWHKLFFPGYVEELT